MNQQNYPTIIPTIGPNSTVIVNDGPIGGCGNVSFLTLFLYFAIFALIIGFTIKWVGGKFLKIWPINEHKKNLLSFFIIPFTAIFLLLSINFKQEQTMGYRTISFQKQIFESLRFIIIPAIFLFLVTLIAECWTFLHKKLPVWQAVIIFISAYCILYGLSLLKPIFGTLPCF